MPTKAEIEAELAELKKQNEKLAQELAQEKGEDIPLEKGRGYNLSSGYAVIKDFYTEDKIKKIRCQLYKVDTGNGHEVISDEFMLCSYPVERFRELMRDFQKGQVERAKTTADWKEQIKRELLAELRGE